jgi:uncharacterized membrane protein YhiD involved in acid resistance
MKTNFYPDGAKDRILFWLALLSALVSTFLFFLGSYSTAFLNLAAAIVVFTILYFLNDKPEEDDAKEYSVIMIERVSEIADQIKELSSFFEQEKKRIPEIESAVKALNEQKAQLESVLETEEEKVNAILSAHARRMKSSEWKDRAIGFVSGMISSFIIDPKK